MPLIDPAWSTTTARVWLCLLGLVSLFLVTTANRVAGLLLPAHAWLPGSCLASLALCLAVYVAIRPSRPFGGPRPHTPWPRLQRVASRWLALWLLASAGAALVAGHWQRYGIASTPAELLAFLILGPLQEELLFRGAIFELAERSAPGWGPFFPVALSTLLFALHHFQLHGYSPTPAALLQMGYALPMGWVFGVLRLWSGSVWPGLGVHCLTNLPGAVGS